MRMSKPEVVERYSRGAWGRGTDQGMTSDSKALRHVAFYGAKRNPM